MRTCKSILFLMLVFLLQIGCGGGGGTSGGGGSTPPPPPPPTSQFSLGSLNGTYVLTFSGNEADGTTIYFLANFKADGNGTLSNGTIEYNSPDNNSGLQTVSFTGGYSVLADGRSLLTVQTSSPVFSNSNGPFKFQATLRNDANNADIVALDSILYGSGSLYKIDTAAQSATMSGTYSFLLSGGVNGSPGRAEVAAGRMAYSSTTVSGSWDLNLAGVPAANQSFTGAFTSSSDGSGDITIVAAPPNGSYVLPKKLRFHKVAGDRFVFISEDTGTAVLGVAEKQQTTSFSTASLSGGYAFAAYALEYDPANPAIASYRVVAGRFTASGNGATDNGVLDENRATTIYSNVSLQAGTYTIDANGRGTTNIVSPEGSDTLAFYMISASRAAFIGISSGSLSSGYLDVQPTTALTNASLSGKYAFVIGGSGLGESGVLNFDGAGAFTGTLDVLDNGVASTSVSVSGTYSVASNGRVTAVLTQPGRTSNLVFYLANGSAKVVGADASYILIGGATKQ